MPSASVSVQFGPVATIYALKVLGAATFPAVVIISDPTILAPIISGFTTTPDVVLTINTG
jgi:hypothetical protein